MSSTKNYLKNEFDELAQINPPIFQFLLSDSLDGICFWDLENPKNNWMSPQFWVKLGFDPEEKQHLTTAWQDAVYPDDFQTAIESLKNHHKTPDQNYDKVLRYLQKNGSTVWIRCRAITVNGKSGNPNRMMGTLTDISSHQQAYIALQESEEKHNGMFNNALSGIAVYEAKNNGNEFIFKDINKAAQNIENIKKSELIGKNVLDTFPGIKEFGLLEVFKRVWKTGKPEHHPISMYQDDRILGWRENFVYKLPAGEIVTVYTDETEHKKAEQALLDSEKKYRTLFESSIDALFILDAETGKIIDCNNSSLKLHQFESREEFTGLTPDMFSPACQPSGISSKKLVIDYIKKASQEGSAEFEWLHKKKDGTEFFVMVTLSAMNVAGKDLVLAVNRDLTEIKESAKKREQLISDLQKAIEKINTLRGLLPICASCKKIRDDKGYWNQIDEYIQDHSDARFSHSMCPECADKYYGSEQWYINFKKEKGLD